MKKLLSVILSIVMVFSLFNLVSFASTDIIFYTDFESDVVGSLTSSGSIKPQSSVSAIVCAGDTNDNATQHLKLDKRVYAEFSSISSGIFYIDFDAMSSAGYMSVGLVNASSASAKWIFGMPATDGSPYGTWQKLNGIPPTNPSATFKKKGTAETIPYKVNTWESYRLKVDVDNAAVTLFVNGIESDTIKNYEYFGGSNEAITGVVFRNDSTTTQVYLDNIKIHWAEAAVSDVKLKKYDGTYNNDFSAVSVMTECIEVAFTCPMEIGSLYSAVSLRNNTSGEDEVLSRLTMENGDRLLCIYFENPLSPQNSYTFKIAADAEDIYGRKLGDDYILEFTTGEGGEGFSIAEMNIFKNGIPAVWSDLSPGDTITLTAKYLRLGASSEAPELIFAYSAEKNLKICDFNAFKVECNELGMITVSNEVTINSGIEFDSIYFYIWNPKSLAPIVNFIKLNKADE